MALESGFAAAIQDALHPFAFASDTRRIVGELHRQGRTISVRSAVKGPMWET